MPTFEFSGPELVARDKASKIPVRDMSPALRLLYDEALGRARETHRSHPGPANTAEMGPVFIVGGVALSLVGATRQVFETFSPQFLRPWAPGSQAFYVIAGVSVVVGIFLTIAIVRITRARVSVLAREDRAFRDAAVAELYVAA